jgi:hypothetical protein
MALLNPRFAADFLQARLPSASAKGLVREQATQKNYHLRNQA